MNHIDGPMTQRLSQDTLNQPVHQHMQTDFVSLEATLTVDEALKQLRENQPTARIVYFYVTHADGTLLGVVPTRRLLLSAPGKRLSEIMIEPVIAIPSKATVLDACEFFILYKLLAFPVVDEKRRMIGLVDVELYTQELSDLDRRESQNHLFQLLGVQWEARQRSASYLFRRRFPWLLAPLAGGLLAAKIIEVYYDVASSPVVVLFIPLVLALASSVAAQSVSMALQALQGERPSWPWFRATIQRELTSAAFLGIGCGVLTGIVAIAWIGQPLTVATLMGSILVTVVCAALFGLAMPYLFRGTNRSSQVAAGPIALALVDIVSLCIYFTIAHWTLSLR